MICCSQAANGKAPTGVVVGGGGGDAEVLQLPEVAQQYVLQLCHLWVQRAVRHQAAKPRVELRITASTRRRVIKA